MNIKEVAEIKKRFRSDKSNITRIRGCYINEKKEVISKFDQSLALMSTEEADQILSILKKTLSGSIGRNLIDIGFSNNQVLDSNEHRLLTRLNESSLGDDSAFEELTDIIRSSFDIDGNYLILAASDSYDVPSYYSDGQKSDESSKIYSYIMCSICPLKTTKSAIGYFVSENRFKNIIFDQLLLPPQAGFLFPAFDGRQTNIYNALYFTKNIADSHEALTDALFKCKIPMPAAEQKQLFGTILRDTVSEQCDLEMIKGMSEKIGEIIDEHKAVKDPEPLLMSKNSIIDILSDCGIDSEKIESFSKQFDEDFGKNAEIPPLNLVESKRLNIKMPDISIKLSSEMSDKIETKIIDGKKYILILADGTVEVNGIEINIKE